MADRFDICQATAASLRGAAEALGQVRAFIGFDGFVDEICSVVETRGAGFEPETVPTIGRLADKIAGAAGRSSNYEILVRQVKLGGNGPIMASALAKMGMQVTCAGSVGYPEVHPVFGELARRAELLGIAPPAHTDALEFSDGKLMLGKLEPLSQINWESLKSRLGRGKLEEHLGRSRLIGLVNWTMIPQMSRIWARLISDVLPKLPEHPDGRRSVIVDLADPEKRTIDDLRYALRLLAHMQELVDVTLGMNLKEARQVCAALGLDEPAGTRADIEKSAENVRRALALDCCVVHPRSGAAAATREQVVGFDGPFVREPRISTGAGDHFNAGFMLARLGRMPLEQCLCTGVAASGHYVRSAEAPSLAGLAAFIQELPEPEH